MNGIHFLEINIDVIVKIFIALLIVLKHASRALLKYMLTAKPILGLNIFKILFSGKSLALLLVLQ